MVGIERPNCQRETNKERREMKLELDRLDLNRKGKGVACSRISFKHLSERTQEAAKVVGKATFWEFDRRNYNVVYPPAEGKT